MTDKDNQAEGRQKGQRCYVIPMFDYRTPDSELFDETMLPDYPLWSDEEMGDGWWEKDCDRG